MQPLVSTEWLAPQLGAADLKVFDASWYMPAEQRDAQGLYRAAHIPTAQFFDIDQIADTESSLPHMAPTAARFERLISALGVHNGDRVVFYDQKGIFSAARGWWLMRLFGHAAVAVLDGGLPKWQREGRPIVSGDEPAPTPGLFRAAYNARYLRGLGDVAANLTDGRELVLDARSADRFYGRVPEPRPGVRSGHVPGSRSLPYTTVLALLGRVPVPVPQLVARQLANVLWATQLASAPPSLLDYLLYTCVADGERARRELGYAPRFSIKRTLGDFLGIAPEDGATDVARAQA